MPTETRKEKNSTRLPLDVRKVNLTELMKQENLSTKKALVESLLPSLLNSFDLDNLKEQFRKLGINIEQDQELKAAFDNLSEARDTVNTSWQGFINAQNAYDEEAFRAAYRNYLKAGSEVLAGSFNKIIQGLEESKVKLDSKEFIQEWLHQIALETVKGDTNPLMLNLMRSSNR